MTVKDFSFNRDFLKHINYKNGFHVYTSMETVSDRSGNELPESIIKLLYRIYAEAATANDVNENKCEGE